MGFLNFICMKTRPYTRLLFYMNMNQFDIVFHMTWVKSQCL